ncbi:hypothetical protein STEG23_002757 [Scotinomys teguina]
MRMDLLNMKNKILLRSKILDSVQIEVEQSSLINLLEKNQKQDAKQTDITAAHKAPQRQMLHDNSDGRNLLITVCCNLLYCM